ncbi:MAG: sigma-70 family RNA polymerase sigma factor [Myxococcota bacterium]
MNSPGDPERPLIDAWVAGDAQAGDALLARYYQRVLRFFAIRQPLAAEDLTQRTFLACAEARGSIRDRNAFASFVFGVARHQMLRYQREREYEERRAKFPDFAGPDEAGPSPSQVIVMHEEQQLVLRALQELPLEVQWLIELYYWERMNTTQIAAVLEVPVSTVTSRLMRARRRLREVAEQLVTVEPRRQSLLQDFEAWVASIRELRVE